MKLYIDKVSFNNQDFTKLGFGSETWEFGTKLITTPKGKIHIESYEMVDRDNFVGVELYTWGSTLNLGAYEGFDGDESVPSITIVAFVRNPNNVWLWVYLMDEDGETIATFCGHEDLDSFPKYIEELQEEDFSLAAHLKAEKYKMLDLEGGYSHNAYGDIAILRANPIVNNGFGDSYAAMHQYEDTEYFYFKDDEQLLEKLNKIGHGDGLWTPNPEDYEDEMCTDEKGKRREVHLHISLWDEEYETEDESMLNNGEDVCLIPEAAYKARQLNNQFYQRGWYEEYSFRGYVESLAEGDDVQGFWSWLFGVPGYDGLMPWNLPSDYYAEYERFLDICSEMDNN